MAKGIAHRDWTISRDEFRDDDGRIDDMAFRAAIEQEMALNVQMMDRLGVAVISAPIRRQWPGGGWYTEAYVFKTATVPGLRDPEPDVEPEIADLESALVEDPDDLAHVE